MPRSHSKEKRRSKSDSSERKISDSPPRDPPPKKHDMSKFESEPESGELTHSSGEESDDSRYKAMRSTVKVCQIYKQVSTFFVIIMPVVGVLTLHMSGRHRDRSLSEEYRRKSDYYSYRGRGYPDDDRRYNYNRDYGRRNGRDSYGSYNDRYGRDRSPDRWRGNRDRRERSYSRDRGDYSRVSSRNKERSYSRDRQRRERSDSRDRSRNRRNDNIDKRNDENKKDDEDNKETKNQRESRKRPADDSNTDKNENNNAGDNAEPPTKKAKDVEKAVALTTRTGGAYIPPASVEYQRIAWEALKKSINGHINKVNVSNLVDVVQELFQENIVRGRGLLARSVIQAQAASPTFTHVYAALVAIVNTRFPQVGELILRRLVIQFRRGYKRNDKNLCLSTTRFIAHLVNQQVAHEVLALEILTLLLENPTDDSVEVSVGFLKECGQKLTEVTPRGINAIFERLRNVLHEGQIDTRVQYMVEVMFAIRKDGFKMCLRLTLITLRMKRNIKCSREVGEKETIIDNTETNLIALRRTIYLTIQSSLDFEECAHKLLKMELKPGQEVELCNMILDCCAQQRTYEKFYGLLAQRFCQIDKKYIEPFQNMFIEQYDTIHRLETNKLRNVAKFFAHLLHTDAISWQVISCIKLNEEDTTSASRIFIKILFQELSEYLGLPKLNERLKDPDDLRDHLKNMTKQLMQQKQQKEEECRI
ncbi:hypothetical protein KUTeg_001599 [Tegillarca granosa]|uniref:MI domain-containing protein n=1 Tax=Tegillarca granosa TaxID=220873 RepID=A0ABQ9FTG0_TEGGR|nr:hypothetical protein KUTeg_001599 [Tegillarca granosa]